MRRIMLVFLMELLTSISIYAQCYTPPSTWMRRLSNHSYTWYWDGNLNGAQFSRDDSGFPLLTSGEAQSLVQSAIAAAVTKWQIATGNRVAISEGTTTRDIIIRFTPREEFQYGYTYSDALIIEINPSIHEGFWTDNTAITTPTNYFAPDIYTVVLHEMGHIFMGDGHSADLTSVMIYNSQLVKRSLTTCDQQIAAQKYTLPNKTITLKNNFPGGSLIVESSTILNVTEEGVIRAWEPYTTHTVSAIDNQDVDGYVRIFHSWTATVIGEDETFELTRNITVIDDGIYTANFNKQFNVNALSAICIEPGSGGTYNITRTNPPINLTNQTTWSGTSVQNVDAPITLQAVPPSGPDWLFVRWSDGTTQNPYYLIPTDHTNLYAIFKKHLVSNVSSATGSNNQRRIVQDYSNTLYFVYESGGGIFQTISTNGGATWSNETAIALPSVAGPSMRSPAVAVYDASTVGIVWESINHAGSQWNHVIKMNVAPANNIAYFTTTTDQEATPAVYAGSGFVFIAWRDVSALKYAVTWPPYGFDNTVSGTIPGTAANSAHPTIAVRAYDFYYLYVAWEEAGTSGGVKYSQGHFSTLPVPAGGVTWTSSYSVATNSSTVMNARPSLVRDGSGNISI